MFINKYQQQGLAGSTIAFLLVFLIIILIIFFKLFPLYMDNMKISNVLANIQVDEESLQKDEEQLRKAFLTGLQEKDIDFIYPENVREHVIVEKTVEGFIMTVKYVRTKPLMGNVSFLVEFEKTIEAP